MKQKLFLGQFSNGSKRTVLTGKRGSEAAEGEDGVGGFSSEAAIAC